MEAYETALNELAIQNALQWKLEDQSRIDISSQDWEQSSNTKASIDESNRKRTALINHIDEIGRGWYQTDFLDRSESITYVGLSIGQICDLVTITALRLSHATLDSDRIDVLARYEYFTTCLTKTLRGILAGTVALPPGGVSKVYNDKAKESSNET
ncbi:MAG: DUF4254 domain-containing protein [Acidimicrobiales bacterium]|jgi:hypothetical protein